MKTNLWHSAVVAVAAADVAAAAAAAERHSRNASHGMVHTDSVQCTCFQAVD